MISLFSVLKWGIVGVISGGASKFVGADSKAEPPGIIGTILLGVGGALLGGYIGQQLGFGSIQGFDGPSFIAAVAGGVTLVVLKTQFSR